MLKKSNIQQTIQSQNPNKKVSIIYFLSMMAKPCTRYNMHLPHNTHHRHYNIHDYVAEQRLRLLLKLPDSVPIKEYLKRRNCYRSNKSALTKRAYSGIKSEVRPHLQKAKSEIQEKIKKIERESLVRDGALDINIPIQDQEQLKQHKSDLKIIEHYLSS